MRQTGIEWKGHIPWEDVPYEIELDRFGVASSTLHVQFEFESAVQAANRIRPLEIHPEFPWLVRKKATISREEACLAKASIVFEGIPPNTDVRTYSLKTSLSSEAIQTHPDFRLWMNEGLVALDSKGKVQFLQSPDAEDSLVAAENWLVPSLIYEEIWVRGSSGGANDFSRLGKIMNPPSSNAMPGSIGGKKNFILFGGDIELVGFGSRMTRRWRLSGPRGWNGRIYR